MTFIKSVLSTTGLRMVAAVLLLALAGLVAPTHQAEAAGAFVVRSDRGGYLADRLLEIDNLQRTHTPVEIRGRVCYSTCTMFIGLQDTCVDPQTTFGFHGPSAMGKKLPPEQFDYFSEVMAAYYPPQLRDWFMREGRHKIFGVYKMKGAELIRMGVPACNRT